MNTFAKTNQNRLTINEVKTETKTKVQSDFWKKAEENRFGITPMVLVVMACMGGVAAATGILESWVKLAAVAFPATISLAMILAVAPMKAIYVTAVIAVIMDLLVIFF